MVLIQLLLGKSWRTSLVAIILAAMLAIQQEQAAGHNKWRGWLLPVGIAIFGRISGDASKKQNDDNTPSTPAA